MTTCVAVTGAAHEIWRPSERLRARIASAGRLFLFADFDGTLAPRVDDPGEAFLPAGTRSVLRDLAVRHRVTAAVVSGRALEDLEARVGSPLPLICAGNHGLEIRGAGLSHTVPEAQESRFRLLAACNRLRGSLQRFAGALVECKRLTASVHVRRVDRGQMPAVRDAVFAVMRGYPEFLVFDGDQAFEIRPRCAWDKGSAARWILDQMGGRESDAICLGDQADDENMFRELKAGIAVRVGPPGATRAQYCVEQRQVFEMLCWIAEIRANRQAGR